jgi:hypothetical protein
VGVDIRLAVIYDSAYATCAKACITYIKSDCAGFQCSWSMYLGLEFFTYISCYKTWTVTIPCVSLFLPLHHFFSPNVSWYWIWTVGSRRTARSIVGKWQWLLRAVCCNGAAISNGCVSLRFHFPWMEKGLWISNASDMYGEYAQDTSDATVLQDEVFV